MSESKSKPKILVLMSGSIACYKACGLISMLVKNGYEVKVAASASALKFIGEATIEGLTGEPVQSDLWKKGSAMEHIHLERWADLIIAAPASAHFINRIAHGVGDDLLTTIFLAHEFKKPFLIAPAMNTAMYLNPVTQKSLESLKSFGLKILEAASGVLACGETGYGKLLEPDLLFQEIQSALNHFSGLSTKMFEPKLAKNILVTAGGTREALDDVRFLSNSSTGITGEKIAAALSELGFNVTLDLAASSLVKPQDLYKVKKFDSFSSLSSLLQEQLSNENFDLVIHAAAVSDFSVDKSEGKLPSNKDVTLNLKRNPKLVNSLKEWSKNKNIKLIAFKLTSQAPEDQIKSKVIKILEEAHADAVVQNDIKSVADRDLHKFKIFNRNNITEATGVDNLINEIVKVGIYDTNS
jgi:phosphopantothenoylcysteine decarboxylase/phosphopantothenate--cysteine ligase